MRRLWAIVVALAGIISTSAASSVDFSRLDSLIAEQSHIIDRKEAHLSQLKERLSRETAPADRYGTIKQLYEEYAAYQYDSAYAYVSQCLDLARQMSDDRLLNESRLDLAHILSTACLMDQARLLLGQIDTTRLSATQLIRYYRTCTDLLIYQAEYMQGTQYAAEAVQQLIDLRRRTAALNVPHDDVNYLLTLAECRADSGQSRQAISLLEGLMQHYHSGERLYSIITSTMSFHYHLIQL